MEHTTLQPNTIQALRYFLSIWKQDPASRYILGISNSNAFLWDNDQPEQCIEVTPQAEMQTTNEIDKLLGTIDTPDTTPPLQVDTTENPLLSQLKEDLNQTLHPQEVSHVNPYIAADWKTQVDKILKSLPQHSKSRQNQITMIEAHFYLGSLLEKESLHQDQIKELIRKQKGDRRSRDIVKGAQRIHQLFSLRSKDLIYQTNYLAVTQIVKLTNEDFELLVNSLKS
jgi:hypothetical protein